MKKLLFLSLLSLCFSPIFSQGIFSKVYHLPDEFTHMQANSIIELPDSSMVMAGIFDYDPVLIKIDRFGNLMWTKSYGIHGSFFKVKQDTDSTLISVGYQFKEANNSNAFVIKTNFDGDTIWTRELETGVNERGYDIEPTLDNGYMITGYATPDSLNYSYYHYQYQRKADGFIAKLDSVGGLSWCKTVSNNDGVCRAIVFYSSKQYNDSIFYAVGYIDDSVASTESPAIVIARYDDTGNVNWAKRHDATSFYSSYGFDLFADTSGIVFLSHIGNDICLFKTDTSANNLWARNTEYYPGYDMNPIILHNTQDNGFLISTGFGYAKYDYDGNSIFATAIFNLSNYDCIETLDGGYANLGAGPLWLTKTEESTQISLAKTDISGTFMDCWDGDYTYPSTGFTISFSDIDIAVRDTGSLITIEQIIDSPGLLERYGCIDIYGSAEENNLESEVIVYPNPSNGVIFVEGEDIEKIEIFSVGSQQLAVSSFFGEAKCKVDLSGLKSGLYFVKVTSSGGVWVEKVVVE